MMIIWWLSDLEYQQCFPLIGSADDFKIFRQWQNDLNDNNNDAFKSYFCPNASETPKLSGSNTATSTAERTSLWL